MDVTCVISTFFICDFYGNIFTFSDAHWTSKNFEVSLDFLRLLVFF